MTINFIPNDPLAADPPMRRVAARPDRASGRAGFTVSGNQPENTYPPGSPGFLRWQARQAAILAVETWEKVLGQPITTWAAEVPNPKRLALVPDAGDDLNAYYDRQSVSFFHHDIGASMTFSGASTDVVAHEVGHAILDAVRPDLWDTNYLEVGGFHEGFGDVTAIITALADRKTRLAVLAVSPDLSLANMVETTAEDLSHAVLDVLGPQHPASKPRQALNTFVWQLPSTMPTTGGPDVMIAEVHSLARIISGCFWDVLRGLFDQAATQTEATLWTATRNAAKLFHAASVAAPEVPRFFRAVGRAMVLADADQNGGANRELIGQAFAGHGLPLGSNAMLAAEMELAGPAPTTTADGAHLAAATTKQLRSMFAVPAKVRLQVAPAGVDATAAAVRYRVPVALGDVDSRLAGVTAGADVHALVGSSGGRAALLGGAPIIEENTNAVKTFVASLVTHGQLELPPRRTKSKTAVATRGDEARPTHVIAGSGRNKVVQRVAFACGCDHRHSAE
jgi:hypothetical protein